MKYGITVPTRYDDIIQPLLMSLKILSPQPRVVIVADGHERDYGYELAHYVGKSKHKFVYAAAANLGIQALDDLDVILLNDDISFDDKLVFQKLQAAAYFNERVGIVSPLIQGCVGQLRQRWWEHKHYWPANTDLLYVDVLCFPCVYLRRAMINEIGLLDEKFINYGGDDDDYSARARKAGWRLAVMRDAVVVHGDGSRATNDGVGKSWSQSYFRRYPTIFTGAK